MRNSPFKRRAVPTLGIVGLALGLALPPPAPGRAPTASGPGAVASLARYAPRKDLVVYVEYAGLDAHPEAWRQSAAYKLLNETTLGAMLEDLIGQLAKSAATSAKEVPALKPEETGTLVRHVARNGFVLAANGKPPAEPGVVIVLRNASRKDVRALFGKLLGPAGGKDAKLVTKGSRKVIAVTPGSGKPWAWWPEQDDLVIAPPGSDVDAICATIDGTRPNAVDHPIRAKLADVKDGFQPVGVAFLDMTAIPKAKDAAQFGLANLQRLDLRWGFQDDALMTVLRIVSPGPREGILALFDSPTFNLKGVPAVPAGVNGFTVASIDLGKFYDQVVGLAKTSDPQAGAKVAAGEKAAREVLGGLRVREDILSHLGPKVGFFMKTPAPPKGGAGPPDGMMMPGMMPGMGGPTPEIVISAQVDAPAAFVKTLDKLMAAVNKQLKAQAAARPPGPGAPGTGPKPGGMGAGGPTLEFKKGTGKGTTYTLTLPQGMLPPGMMVELKPTVTLGKSHLVIASTADAALKALKAESASWAPGDDYRAMADRLPKRMIFLNVSDPRDSLPALIAGLPMMIPMINGQMQAARGGPGGPGGGGGGIPIQVDPAKVPKAEEVRSRLFPGWLAVAVDDQDIRFITRESTPSVTSPVGGGVAVALLLPAVQSAREAARRAQCSNNLKQIGLAMHNYHSAFNSFPPAGIAGKDGKPLLSWRVAILPFIEQQALYNQFKLDEPWDSPNNMKLLQSMPKTYACPSVPNLPPGHSTYRVIVGKGAPFEGTKGLSFQDFTDGTSNTLMVVESQEAVPWTKPDDLALDTDPNGLLTKLASPHKGSPPGGGGFNALFADGSVRFLKLSIDLKTFRALTTRNGKEVVNPGSF